MFEEEYPGTCLSCGFLGERNRLVYGHPVQEYVAASREKGALGSYSTLWCFRRMAVPQAEYARAIGQSMRTYDPDKIAPETRMAALTEILRTPRTDCTEKGIWTKYEEHFTPKEHYEFWRIMELEELRQKQAEMLTKFAEQQVKITDVLNQTVTDQTALQAQSHMDTHRYNNLIGALALASVLLAVAAVVFQIPWVIDRLDGDVDPVVVVTPTPPQSPDTLEE